MAEAPLIRILPGGNRLRLQHGPIDLVIRAYGAEDEIRSAYFAAATRFEGLLAELCAELALLRTPVRRSGPLPEGIVARRMYRAVEPLATGVFLTPMAAVAGAVAEEILAAMTAAAPLSRAFVNNGGDIALYLTEGESFKVGLVDRPDRPSLFGTSEIAAYDGIAGIATSGYPGRSFSLGIAEAVTILAPTAAMADAAATVVANAVDLPGHPAIERQSACSFQTDSDLGERLVTRAVGSLTRDEIALALSRGLAEASRLREAGLIRAAALHLQGESRILPPLLQTEQSKGRALVA